MANKLRRMEASNNSNNDNDSKNWQQITLPVALTKYRDHTHVAHCMLWFKTSQNQACHMSYAFLQLRFDGLLAFPGGEVHEDITDTESIIDGLQRELLEEINYRDTISIEDYFYTYYNSKNGIVSHLFAKQISLKEAEQLEESHRKARNFPRESLGVFRVPIGCSYEGHSQYLRGFISNFLLHQFSGNVPNQIVDVVEKYNVMTKGDLDWTKSKLKDYFN